MGRAWTMVVAGALLGLVACGGETDEELGWEANQLMRDTLSEGAAPADSVAEGLTVTLTEWNVRLAQDTVPAGPTRIRARNIGEYDHVLEVAGNGEEWATDTLSAGDWATIEADLRPGTYEVYCPVEGDEGVHRDLGMAAFLVVR